MLLWWVGVVSKSMHKSEILRVKVCFLLSPNLLLSKVFLVSARLPQSKRISESKTAVAISTDTHTVSASSGTTNLQNWYNSSKSKKVPPRFELGLPESEPDVITTYTMGPYPELLCRTNTNFLPAPTIIESTTCTQKTLNSSSSLQPTLLKHGTNGTIKRNNTEDQKTLNSKK